jgi:catechol 2,3-dioxygenase-like lactoylglutathione lyase family enzyme
MDHIGVVARDLEAARRFWCNVIGLQVDVLRSPIGKGRHDDSDNVNVLDIPIGSGAIECINPADGTSGTARFLEKYGGSVGGAMHHVSLAAKDVKAAADFVQANGMKLIGVATNDRAWVHPKSAMGSLIEIVRDEG